MCSVTRLWNRHENLMTLEEGNLNKRRELKCIVFLCRVMPIHFLFQLWHYLKRIFFYRIHNDFLNQPTAFWLYLSMLSRKVAFVECDFFLKKISKKNHTRSDLTLQPLGDYRHYHDNTLHLLPQFSVDSSRVYNPFNITLKIFCD